METMVHPAIKSFFSQVFGVLCFIKYAHTQKWAGLRALKGEKAKRDGGVGQSGRG